MLIYGCLHSKLQITTDASVFFFVYLNQRKGLFFSARKLIFEPSLAEAALHAHVSMWFSFEPSLAEAALHAHVPMWFPFEASVKICATEKAEAHLLLHF